MKPVLDWKEVPALHDEWRVKTDPVDGWTMSLNIFRSKSEPFTAQAKIIWETDGAKGRITAFSDLQTTDVNDAKAMAEEWGPRVLKRLLEGANAAFAAWPPKKSET